MLNDYVEITSITKWNDKAGQRCAKYLRHLRRNLGRVFPEEKKYRSELINHLKRAKMNLPWETQQHFPKFKCPLRCEKMGKTFPSFKKWMRQGDCVKQCKSKVWRMLKKSLNISKQIDKNRKEFVEKVTGKALS